MTPRIMHPRTWMSQYVAYSVTLWMHLQHPAATWQAAHAVQPSDVASLRKCLCVADMEAASAFVSLPLSIPSLLHNACHMGRPQCTKRRAIHQYAQSRHSHAPSWLEKCCISPARRHPCALLTASLALCWAGMTAPHVPGAAESSACPCLSRRN